LKSGLRIVRRVWATSPRAVRAGREFDHITHAPVRPAEPTARNRRRENRLLCFFKLVQLVTVFQIAAKSNTK
jgi:hypothetical protein